MRDIKRIKNILGLIESIWLLFPDLRLGQLLYNFAGFKDANYNTEDFITEKYLQMAVEKIRLDWEKQYNDKIHNR